MVNLAGTPLASLATDTVLLSDFVLDPITFNQFSITEITIDGVAAPTAQTVGIDVKPRSTDNRINLRGARNVKVAILSSAGFDAARVVPSSLTFGRTGS